MKRTTTAVCLREFGVAEEVARLEEWPLPDLQPHQVLVNVLAAPINPADLNLLEGTYGVRPSLPAVAGNEGVGVIAECGRAVTGLAAGQRVIAPIRPGWWCASRILDGTDVFPMPDDVPLETAAMMAVNPPTAWRMLHDFVTLPPGDWIVQNAANSVVGRSAIQIAKHRGWRTVNVVRREELIPELRGAGADVVVTDATPLSRLIKELTSGAAVPLALNAVGGESARQLAKSLAPHGTLVTYGAMAREPLRIDNGLLIFQDIRFRGFWIREWYRHASRPQIEEMFRGLVALARAGRLPTPVEKSYPLAQVREALAHARRSGRNGKILLSMDDEVGTPVGFRAGLG